LRFLRVVPCPFGVPGESNSPFLLGISYRTESSPITISFQSSLSRRPLDIISFNSHHKLFHIGVDIDEPIFLFTPFFTLTPLTYYKTVQGYLAK